MNLWQDLAILFAIAALIVACVPKTRAPLRAYFFTQLFASIANESIYRHFGGRSPAYIGVFIATDVVILGAMLRIVMVSLAAVPSTPRRTVEGHVLSCSLLTAAITGTLIALSTSPHGYDYLAIVDGSLTLALAIPMGVSAKFLHGADAKVALSLLWLWALDALFEYGFSLAYPAGEWRVPNALVPRLLIPMGCLWIAWFCQPPKSVRT